MKTAFKNFEKKLNEKADESDLDELRSFVNVLSVQGVGAGAGAGKEGGGGAPMMMPPMPNKDSKKIKELLEKTSELDEKVNRNTSDLQKLKDLRDKQKHLATLIDKKADIEGLKRMG